MVNHGKPPRGEFCPVRTLFTSQFAKPAPRRWMPFIGCGEEGSAESLATKIAAHLSEVGTCGGFLLHDVSMEPCSDQTVLATRKDTNTEFAHGIGRNGPIEAERRRD